jgi:hypothetical protein
MIRILGPERLPRLLAERGPRAHADLCEAFDRGEMALNFDAQIYGSFKEALAEAQYGKCCYCEAKILPVSSGDVDHFRPKGTVRQEAGGEALRPGYFWLAYDPENLLFACEKCNRSHKRDLFPLRDPERRSRHPFADLAEEEPLLINPRQSDPQEHIGFRDEYPYPIGDGAIGRTTINCLGLDREQLNEARRDHLAMVRVLWNLAEAIPRELPETAEAQLVLARLCEAPAPFAAATRALCNALNGKRRRKSKRGSSVKRQS